MCSACAWTYTPVLAQFVLAHKLHYELTLSWNTGSNMCTVSAGTWVLCAQFVIHYLLSLCDFLQLPMQAVSSQVSAALNGDK